MSRQHLLQEYFFARNDPEISQLEMFVTFFLFLCKSFVARDNFSWCVTTLDLVPGSLAFFLARDVS